MSNPSSTTIQVVEPVWAEWFLTDHSEFRRGSAWEIKMYNAALFAMNDEQFTKLEQAFGPFTTDMYLKIQDRIRIVELHFRILLMKLRSMLVACSEKYRFSMAQTQFDTTPCTLGRYVEICMNVLSEVSKNCTNKSEWDAMSEDYKAFQEFGAKLPDFMASYMSILSLKLEIMNFMASFERDIDSLAFSDVRSGALKHAINSAREIVIDPKASPTLVAEVADVINSIRNLALHPNIIKTSDQELGIEEPPSDDDVEDEPDDEQDEEFA